MLRAMSAPAGWYPDPEHPGYQRRWDGSEWGHERQPDPPGRRGIGWGWIVGLSIVVAVVLGVVFGLAPSMRPTATTPTSQLTAQQAEYIEAVRAVVTGAGLEWTDDATISALSAGSTACEFFARHSDLDRSLAEVALVAGGIDTIPEWLRPTFGGVVSAASTHLCP